MKYKNRALIILIAGIMLFTGTVAVSAHTLYIQSSRFNVHEGADKPIFFGWGHHVPLDDGISGKKLKSIKIIDPLSKTEEIPILKGKGLHSSMVKYNKKGTYTLTATTNPGYYTIYKDKKGREHHAIKPKSEIKNAEKIIMSLLSFQSSKAYVNCGSTSDSMPEPAGLDLELVLLKKPFDLKPGNFLPIQVLYKGKPYNGEGEWSATYNGYSEKFEDYLYQKNKTSGDRFEIPVTHTGVWYVRYSFKIKTSGKEAKLCDQLKHSTSLVFEVE